MGFNLAEDPNQLAAFIIILIFTPICTLAIVLRFAATRRAPRKVGWEDWFALLAYIFYVIYVALLLAVILILNGRNIVLREVSPAEIVKVTKIGYVFAAQFCLQQLFAKFSLLFLYHRIFSIDRTFNICVKVLGALQLAWSIATYLVHWFVCTPPQKLWDTKLPGHCINNGAFLAGGEAINSFLDFALVGLAIWIVHSMQLKTSDKMKLGILFALGGLAGVIGFVKIGENFAGDFSSLLDAVWAVIQQAFSVICCCAPIYKSLLPGFQVSDVLRSARRRLKGKGSTKPSAPSSGDSEFSNRGESKDGPRELMDLHGVSTRELVPDSEQRPRTQEYV